MLDPADSNEVIAESSLTTRDLFDAAKRLYINRGDLAAYKAEVKGKRDQERARQEEAGKWQALARQSGGAVVFDSGAQFAAAAFLPLCPGCRIQKSPSTQELLEDRFSLPYLFLSGYCAGPW